MIDHAYLQYGTVVEIQKYLETYKQFPPSQKPASFCDRQVRALSQQTDAMLHPPERDFKPRIDNDDIGHELSPRNKGKATAEMCQPQPGSLCLQCRNEADELECRLLGSDTFRG